MMYSWTTVVTKECNSIDRAICGIWTSRCSSRFRGEPAGPETNHRPVCSTIRGIRAAWCAGAVGGDSEVMWQWCVYVSVLSVVWMPVVFQNVSKHGRSSWTSFWKPYMMISIEELEVSHPKVCHAVSRQAQGHSFWRFSMERCSYYKKEPTGSVFLVASTPSKTKSFIQCGCISPWLRLFGWNDTNCFFYNSDRSSAGCWNFVHIVQPSQGAAGPVRSPSWGKSPGIPAS